MESTNMKQAGVTSHGQSLIQYPVFTTERYD